MEVCSLTLGTVTRAIRGRKLLAAGGIPSRTVKTMERRGGCAYGLEIAAAHLADADRILKENGLAYEWTRGSGYLR